MPGAIACSRWPAARAGASCSRNAAPTHPSTRWSRTTPRPPSCARRYVPGAAGGGAGGRGRPGRGRRAPAHRRRDGGHRRRGRADAHDRRGARRQARAAGEQGIAGDGGALLHGRRARGQCRAAAHRQRAQRDLPVPAGGLSCRAAIAGGAPPAAHRLRRAVSQLPTGRARARDAGAGVRASELGDGAQDLGGLGHHDEQGAGADRGLLAVRHAELAHRGA